MSDANTVRVIKRGDPQRRVIAVPAKIGAELVRRGSHVYAEPPREYKRRDMRPTE